MILTAAERRDAMRSVFNLLQEAEYDIQSVEVLSPAREVHSDMPGARKYVDTGVRIITIVGHMLTSGPPEILYGPTTSEDVGIDLTAMQVSDCDVCGLPVRAKFGGYWFHGPVPQRNPNPGERQADYPHAARVNGEFKLAKL